MFKILPLIVSLVLAGGATVATQNSISSWTNTSLNSTIGLDMRAPISADLQTDSNPDLYISKNSQADNAGPQLQASLNSDGFIGLPH